MYYDNNKSVHDVYLLARVAGPLELDGAYEEVRADLPRLHQGDVELAKLLPRLLALRPVALALVLTSLLQS